MNGLGLSSQHLEEAAVKQKQQQTFSVRMERLPNRLALEHMREAYQRLYQAADSVENEKPIQEAQHEPEFDRHTAPSGSDLCQGVDLAARTGSDH
jgi:hypothetical protein